MYGAIGNCIEPTMMLGESTNTVEFIKFLKQVLDNLKPGSSKPYLVIDNASSHINSEARQFIAEHFFPLNVVQYSCQFNSIEHLWARVKQNLRRLILDYPEEIDEDTWRNLVHESWHMISPSVFEAMTTANRSYLSDLLEA